MITRTFSSLVLTALGALVFTGISNLSQSQHKIIEWANSPAGSNGETVAPSLQLFRQIDAVQIEAILVEGKQINMGEPVTARDDWLKTIVFRVKNTSDQRLLTVQITLVLPAMGPGSPQVIYCYGCGKEERERGINPGEVVELKMPDAIYDFVVSRVAEKSSMSGMSKAQFSHMYVTPPSGPTWYSGCVKTANPKSACPVETRN